MMLYAHVLLAAGLAYLAFCRIFHMTPRTRPQVRWAMSMLGASAFALAIAPFVWGLQVHFAVLLFLGAHMIVLIAMSPLWKYGTPEALRR